jgi:alditol oxidase
MGRVLSLHRDGPRSTVTVEAGITYGQLCRQLDGTGYALHNLASLPHISVAGACATATHGSGDRNGNLASAATAIELVTADGTMKTLSRDADGDAFRGAVVSLGGLGIVTKVTLAVVPAFEVAQQVYEWLPLADLYANLDEITSSAYSVSLFTDWRGDAINQVWLKRRVGDVVSAASRLEALGATPAAHDLHPIASISAENCTPQMNVAGASHDRLPHFRMDHTPSAGEELQSEYLVPREHAVAALRAVDAMRGAIAPHLLISEVRTIAADELWMSPCYHQPCVGIHFTWKKDWPAVSALLPQIDRQLAPFAARPHWGKLFTMPAVQLQPLYAKLPDFRELLTAYDRQGKFRNPYLHRHILGGT